MGCGKHPDSREQPRLHTSDQPGRQQGNDSGDLLMACNVLSDIPISTPLRSWQSSLMKLEGDVLSWVLTSTARCRGERPSLPGSPGRSGSQHSSAPRQGAAAGGVTLRGVTLTPGGDRGERSPCACPRGSQGTVPLHSGLEQVPKKHLHTSPKRVTPRSGCAHPASSLRQRDGERGDAALCPPY